MGSVLHGCHACQQVVHILVPALHIFLHLQVNGGIDLVAASVDTGSCFLLADAVLVHQHLGELVDGSVHHPTGRLIRLDLRILVLLRMQLLVLLGIGKDDVLRQRRLVFIVRNGAVAVHLIQHIFLALPVLFVTVVDPLPGFIVHIIRKGVQLLRVLGDRRQAGSLRHGQFIGVLAEILDGSHFNAVGRAAEADGRGADEKGIDARLGEAHGAHGSRCSSGRR